MNYLSLYYKYYYSLLQDSINLYHFLILLLIINGRLFGIRILSGKCNIFNLLNQVYYHILFFNVIIYCYYYKYNTSI
jgi:hypothetical protein